MQYLLSIAIGPVQEFIATARRSRDLWFGSWLLSELSKAAAKSIVQQNGKLVFPFATSQDLDQGSLFSVVNKIVAEIEAPDANALNTMLDETVFCAMQKRLRDLRNIALTEVRQQKINGNAALDWMSAKAQIHDLIEYYWAAYPFDDLSQYGQVRKQVEALLAARKTTRNFSDSRSWSQNVPKSSLDGLRESVIDEAVYDGVKKGRMTEQSLRLNYGVRAGERLCGVGLLKRLGNRNEQDSFFSTSHVAALPLLERLKNKQAVENYLRELTKLLGIIAEQDIKKELGHVPRSATLKPHEYFCNQDGSLLYDGRILFEERFRETIPEKKEEAKKALQKFFKDAFCNENLHPLPYYAVLHADGDFMGIVIDEQAKHGVDKHRELSGELSKFAGGVKEIVEVKHNGSCIYAGGDDVLAFVPLNRALQCARELASVFSKQMDRFTVNENGQIKSPTLSVGFAVGHHLDPLQDTLELARSAEKIAKNQVPGKNALAVTVSKRSGSDRTVKGSWSDKALGGALDQRLNYFVYLHLSDELPDAAAYNLQDVALRLKPPAPPPADATDEQKKKAQEQKETLLKAQRTEAKRILKRKQPSHGKKKELADEVYEKLHDLIEIAELPLNQLADEIIVARLFAQAWEQSGVTKEGAKKWAQENGVIPANTLQSAEETGEAPPSETIAEQEEQRP